MPVRPYLGFSARTRAWPLAARWAATAAVVGVAWGVRYLMYGATAEEPFLLFFPAIILSAMFFDRGSGFLATILSALLAIYFFIVPVYSFEFERGADVFNIVIFGAVGLFLSALIESLQEAYGAEEAAHEGEIAARQHAEAGERERNMLLGELRHRIRNDLQRVSAMMHVQAKDASAETAQALQDASDRINLIGRLYDRLAREDGHAVVDVPVFLKDLLADLRSGMDQLQPVGLFLQADPVLLPVTKAGSVGLVMNELVGSALKHAFPDAEREWTVKVGLRRDGSDVLLTVEDNGRGIAANFECGTGTKLIRAMAAQLGGHLETKPGTGGGTRHVLRFPVEMAATAPERPPLSVVGQAAS